MAKVTKDLSILIVDTPNNCGECICYNDAEYCCQFKDAFADPDIRAEWCPLKDTTVTIGD